MDTSDQPATYGPTTGTILAQTPNEFGDLFVPHLQLQQLDFSTSAIPDSTVLTEPAFGKLARSSLAAPR